MRAFSNLPQSFLPFILIVFINAFVDLGHKIIIQNTVFKVFDGETQILLTILVNGLILLPFILLLSPAGFLSDRYQKPRVIKYSAGVAVMLSSIITLSYYQGWFELAFAMTFLLAIQSAIYSPSKYGYIKELSGKENLASANAIVQSVTIVAILTGVFVFSVIFEHLLVGVSISSVKDVLPAIAPIGWLLVIFSVFEFFQAKKLEETTPGQPDLRFNVKDYVSGQYLKTNLRKTAHNRSIWLSIIGLSVFWGISQVLLAAFPAYAKEILDINNTVMVQGALATSGLGIVIGSILAGALSRHHIETGLVPAGALGFVISLSLLPSMQSELPLVLTFVALGISGGLFIVPLNALIQFHAKDKELGVILAGNNWMQNAVMLGFLSVTALFALFGSSSKHLMYLLAATAFVGAIYTVIRLPQSLVRFVIGRTFASRYRINVMGLNNMPSQGGVLMLGNHISWLDWAMLQIASPRPLRFVMHRKIYEKWYLKWFLDLFGALPISGGNSKTALKQIKELLNAGEVVCLFPEGSISRNGQLGEFKKGYEKAAEGANAEILPFYLGGLWGDYFSRSNEKLKSSNSFSRRQVFVSFGQTLPIDTKAEDLKQKVFELSNASWESHVKTLSTVPAEWISTAKKLGRETSLIDAQTSMTLSGYSSLTGVFLFSNMIKKRSPEQNIGLLLPTSSAGSLMNMAVLLLGKTVVNLNYTANVGALISAIKQADIQSIYTSERFLKKLEKKGIDLQAIFEHVQVYILEELKDEITPIKKVSAMVASVLLPAKWLYHWYGNPVSTADPATILFSSGSEGEPKGVMLSHQNLMANIRQVTDVLDTREEDVVMNALPLFHAFGLTVTTLMPMVEGVPAVCHPDPTDTLTIAKAVARHQVSIFCGTSTFLRMYTRNRRVHPLMLDSLRVVVAGAEKLSPEVREGFKLKFNKDIYEGYGATETSPVASVNIPDRINPADGEVQVGNKQGTVGLPLPGGAFRVVDPETMQELPVGEDGLILFSGVQLMSGYLNDEEKTVASLVMLDNKRWYKTGDKGHLDKDGYLTIVDRYSRFAKVGGEMISLGAVEAAIQANLSADIEILASAIPDGKKGEKIVLLYTPDISEKDISEAILQTSLSPLMRPSNMIEVETIPKLGSGKTDLSKAKTIAMEQAA